MINLSVLRGKILFPEAFPCPPAVVYPDETRGNHMKQSNGLNRFWTLCGLLLAAGCGREIPITLDPNPGHILEALALKPEEMPEGYAPVEDPDVLSLAGIEENPGYIRREADKVIYSKAGAESAWLALYGKKDEVRLMLMGVYFRDSAAAEEYVEVQESRSRPVSGYRLETDEGAWYMFFALSPELEFTESERERIRAACRAYADRLALAPLFDHMDRVP